MKVQLVGVVRGGVLGHIEIAGLLVLKSYSVCVSLVGCGFSYVQCVWFL